MNTSPVDTGSEIHKSDRPLRILLAEDHKVNQKVMIALLGGPGFDLDVVENGAEAISALLENPYDVVLMDIQMPVMDGVTAKKKIRKLPGRAGKIPIIAVIANATPERQKEYLSVGMEEVIAKPVKPQKLFAAMKRCTGVGTVNLTAYCGYGSQRMVLRGNPAAYILWLGQVELR